MKKQNSKLWLQLKETGREIQKTTQKLKENLKIIALGVQYHRLQFEIILPAAFLALCTLYFFPGVYLPGHITHSDMDFGFQKEYLFRIFPVWNFEWSTGNFFNMTRILVLLPLKALGLIFQWDGSSWEKAVIFTFLWGSALSMYFLLWRLFQEDQLLGRLKLPKMFWIWAAIFASVFYAFNPYITIRVQHVYLLAGHMMMPLVFLFAVQLTECFTRVSNRKNQYQNKNMSRWQKLMHKLTRIRTEQAERKVSKQYIIISILGFSMAWAYATVALHYLFFCLFLVTAWVLFRFLRYGLQRRWPEILWISSRFILAGAITIGLLSFYIFPYVSSMMIGSINPPNINSIDSVDMVSRNNLPLYILYLNSYWWGLFDYSTLPWTHWVGGAILFGIMAIALIFKMNNKFVLFFFAWSIAMFGMSFGTKFNAEFFVWLVFQSPISGPIGFIFRDGNKFVGLLSFGMSILLGYGLVSIFEGGYKTWHQIIKQKKSVLRFLNYFGFILIGFTSLTIWALLAYFSPIHKLYFNHFYYPTPVPQAFKETRTFLDETNSTTWPENQMRSLMMPRYEIMVTPGAGYAISTWNAKQNVDERIPPKATSTMDIWSLFQRTYHPQEGSTVFWHTLYEAFVHELSHGTSSNIGSFIRALGVDKVIYHSDIIGYEETNQNAVKNLKKQSDLEVLSENELGFFDIFRVKDPVGWAKFYSRTLLSMSGFSTIDPLFHWPYFDADDTSLQFGHQAAGTASIKDLKPGDIIESRNRLDLLLTQADKSMFLNAFDATLYGNPFYRWAKLRSDTADWTWQLNAIGVQNTKREFDFGLGLAYTFVSNLIDVEPYEDFTGHGVPYNFNAYLDLDEPLFRSDIPEVLDVRENYKRDYDDLPSVFGRNARGDQKYWRVARTKTFPAQPNTGYFFEIILSGRNAHQVHAKVKFYDAAGEEVGVSYVSAPREVETFDFVKFKGLYVTPPEAESFSLEILSMQLPDRSVIWELHKLEVLDLSPVMKPNQLVLNYQAPESENYYLFARNFHSVRGGRIHITPGHLDPQIISTQTSFHNQFQWTELGRVKLEKNQSFPIKIQNLEGFNALNTIAVIPEKDWNIYNQRLSDKIPQLHQLVLLESDIDFEKLGHKQTDNTNMLFSNGHAIQLQSGFLRAPFSILKSDRYNLSSRVQTLTQDIETNQAKSITVQISEQNGKIKYQENLPLLAKQSKVRWLELPDIFLEAGEYEVRLDFRDQSPSLISLSDFREWRSNEFEFLPMKEKFPALECSKDLRISENPLDLFINENQMLGRIERGASCDWISTVSEPIIARPDENFLLGFELESQNTRLLHVKVHFFDRNKKWLDSQIFYLPDRDSFPFFKVEEVITTPARSHQLQLQIITRPNPKSEGNFSFKNFSIKNFAQMPTFDLLTIYNDISPTSTPPKITNITKNYLSYDLDIEPSLQTEPQTYVLQMGESFTPLWGLRDQNQVIEPRTAYLVLNSFPVEIGTEPKTVQYFFKPERAFLIGTTLSLIIFTLWGLILFFCLRHKN